MAETGKKAHYIDISDFEGLSAKQISAAEMLQSGYTQREIAEAIGVHYVTISRWKNNEKFMAAVNKCKQERIRQTQALLNKGAPLATEVLIDLLKTNDKRTQVEVAKYILDRNLGKPTSKTDISVDYDSNNDFDLDALVAEIEAEQEQK